MTKKQIIIGGAIVVAAILIWWFFIRKPAPVLSEPGSMPPIDLNNAAGSHAAPKTAAAT